MRPVPIILAGLACLLLLPGALAQTEDRGYQWDVAGDVPDSELEVVRSGLSLMGSYLDAHAGGDVPATLRAQTVVKVVATGQGNQENGGGGSCCTAFSEGVSRPFFDVQHPHWVNAGLGGAEHHVAHEAAHTWFASLGCISHHDQSLGMWLNEGMAEQMAYAALIDDGQMTESEIWDWMLTVAKSDGQWTHPLVDLSNPTATVWPGHIGYLALHMALDGRDASLIRDFCVQYAGGATREEAFESAFGISLATFYDRFESWKQTEAQGTPPDAARPPPRDTGLQFDVAENVPVEEADAIRYGFGAAQDFLNENLGGDVPANVRAGIAAKIVATGRGNEESGGGGACCTAGSNGQPRPFFDVQHPDWMHEFSFGLPGARDEKIAAHEYTHVWQMHVGSVQTEEHPIAMWISEGMAERVGYLAMVAAGRIEMKDALRDMAPAHTDPQWQRPLSDFGQNTAPAWPGNIGAVALGVALEGRTDGLLSLRKFCEAIGSGSQQEAAFESVFGISLATFYDRFESWKQESNGASGEATGSPDGACPHCTDSGEFRDEDRDGVPDASDNCPDVSNEDQADSNADGVGDSCAADSATAPAAVEDPPPESGQTGSRGIPMPLVTTIVAIGFALGSRRRL